MRYIDKLRKQHIRILDYAVDYESAIRFAAQPLLDDGVIESPYVNAVLDAIKEFGPYICLADDFALPHARPSHHVKETAISLLLIKGGVDLEGSRVKVMMFLAAKDSTAHQELLQKLAYFLMERANIQDLIACNTIDEVYTLTEERWG